MQSLTLTLAEKAIHTTYVKPPEKRKREKAAQAEGMTHGIIEQLLGDDLSAHSRQVRRQHSRLLTKRMTGRYK